MFGNSSTGLFEWFSQPAWHFTYGGELKDPWEDNIYFLVNISTKSQRGFFDKQGKNDREDKFIVGILNTFWPCSDQKLNSIVSDINNF
ncbi:MAG: hypothetical protein HS132_04725 [Planctomycetia bacterium]|nr:hypothetical protein [Planctomycetia bacterium]